MSNKISRRSFLKVSGASALALGAASMLGGCQSSSSNSVEVKVGDKISNWNNLAVQLTSVFTLADAPDVPGSKYVAILVTAVNRSKTDTMAIGAQNVLEIDAAYPLNTEELKAANTAPYFHALSASTTNEAKNAALKDLQALEQEKMYKVPVFTVGNYVFVSNNVKVPSGVEFCNPLYVCDIDFENWEIG